MLELVDIDRGNGMADDEFLAGAEVRTGLIRGSTFGYRAVQYYIKEDEAMFEGDIVLGTVDSVEKMTEAIREEQNTKGAVVIRGEQYRWPNGIVPYTIEPTLPDIRRVQAAIDHWNECTNVWLVPWTNERHYITFRPGVGCSSRIGMQGGQQFITLGPGCRRGNVIHEIGHTLGLWHEQSRNDRDLYIRILWQNIRPGMALNFQCVTDGDDIGPYDYSSIMHY